MAPAVVPDCKTLAIAEEITATSSSPNFPSVCFCFFAFLKKPTVFLFKIPLASLREYDRCPSPAKSLPALLPPVFQGETFHHPGN
jgi:hypothetical protein